MGKKGRSPKAVRLEKTKGLLSRTDELESDYENLVRLVPEVQAALDDTSVPTSVKQEKVDQLSDLVGRIRGFSALLTSQQANKLQIVQSQIRRFKQSIRRGPPTGVPSYAACVDLSSSLNEVGSGVNYSPDLARPAPQPVFDSVAPEEGHPTGLAMSVSGANIPEVTSHQPPPSQADHREANAESQDIGETLPPMENETGTHPKVRSVTPDPPPESTAVRVRPNYPVVVSNLQPMVAVYTSASMPVSQVRSSIHDYSTLDPGDPIHTPSVPALQPVNDSDSALIGFTSPPRSSSSRPVKPDNVGKNPKRGKRLLADGEQPRFNQPLPIRSVAFSIYYDLPSPSTMTHTIYGNPMVYPYRNFHQGRVPLAPIDSPGLPDPSAHSTPKSISNPLGPVSSEILGSHQRQKPWGKAVSKIWDGDFGGLQQGQSVEGHRKAVDPFSMDDPAFPDRWRMPPGPVLQAMHSSHELGKMWKYADQIAIFEGSLQQYIRWAPTFYDMVHVQPMPWAYKINVLATKLSPKISSFVIGSLAFEKRDYITALCRLEKYFGGEERMATLEEFPRIQKDDWLAFRKFLDALETYWLPVLRYQKFVTWCLEFNRVRTPVNFLSWASNRVDPHLLEVQFAPGKPRKQVHFNLADSSGEVESSDSCLDPAELAIDAIHLSSSTDICPKCGAQHSLKKCEQFYLMSHTERKKFVIDNGRCLCCLGVGHRWEQCYSKARCNICSGKHHLLVHEPKQLETNPTFFGYCTSNVLLCYESNGSSCQAENPGLIDARSHLVATAFAVVAIRNPVTRKTVLINALYDTGANNSTISTHVASLLLLDGDPETYVMEVSGGDLKRYKTKYCFVQIGDQHGGHFLEIGVRVLPRPCGTLRHLDWNSVRHHFSQFSGVQLMTPVNRGRVDMILGTDCSFLVAATKPDIVGKRVWDPIIKQTKLGNIPIGVFCPNLKCKSRKRAAFSNLDRSAPAEEVGHTEKSSLPHDNMRQIFNVEDQQTEFLLHQANPVRRILAKHSQAIDQFYSSLRVHNNQATTGLIWKDPRERPKNNFVEAYDLFIRCEEFYRAPEIREAVQEIIEDWSLMGFIFEIDQQVARTEERSFYIPTFVVSRLDKQTTKHRLVFNAAREFVGGSLNDFLMAGPNNVPDLADVLLKFRRYQYTFMADIVQMFMNVLADTKDQPFLRFLHRNVRTGNIQVFQCTRFPFGLSCSPFLAVETVRHTAQTFKQKFSFASEILTSSTIVDDIITSVSTRQQLSDLDEGIKAILEQLTMSTHKKASNSHDFMSGVPETQRAKEIDIKDLPGTNSLPVVKALGLIYVPVDDQFIFRYDPHIPQVWTMRSLVSFAAKLFDPLGFLLLSS